MSAPLSEALHERTVERSALQLRTFKRSALHERTIERSALQLRVVKRRGLQPRAIYDGMQQYGPFKPTPVSWRSALVRKVASCSSIPT
jgi:hypothetical protein